MSLQRDGLDGFTQVQLFWTSHFYIKMFVIACFFVCLEFQVIRFVYLSEISFVLLSTATAEQHLIARAVLDLMITINALPNNTVFKALANCQNVQNLGI